MREHAVKEFTEDFVSKIEQALPLGSMEAMRKVILQLAAQRKTKTIDTGSFELKPGLLMTMNAKEFANEEPYDVFKAGPGGYSYELRVEDGGIRFDMFSNDEKLASSGMIRTSYSFEYGDDIEFLSGDTTILRVPNARDKWINVGSAIDGRNRLGQAMLYVAFGEDAPDSVTIADKAIDLREHFDFFEDTFSYHLRLSTLSNLTRLYHK